MEATDKSIAAGGKNSVKGEFGVSDPYATPGARKATAAELVQKINKIQSIALKARSGFGEGGRYLCIRTKIFTKQSRHLFFARWPPSAPPSSRSPPSLP